MANGITTAFWSVTVNNYDERDLAIFQNGYPDYCREIVYTLEEGEKGTPHIQAWVKLQRQQRMSFVKKLFPGGHFKPLTSDEYIHNTKLYAQKKDETTASASVHRFNDPLHTLESVVKKIGQKMSDLYEHCVTKANDIDIMSLRRDVEKDMVATDYRYAKVLVSSTYKAMWKEFGVEIMMNIRNTHTHTHNEEKFSLRINIPTIDGSDGGYTTNGTGEDEEESSSLGEDSEDYEDGSSETDEGYSEGSDADSGEEAD